MLERVGDAEARKLLEELASGDPGAPLTVEAKAALGRLGEAGPVKPAPTPDWPLWDALAAADGAAAYEAIRALAGRPSAAALLHDRLNGVVATDAFDDEPKRVAKLIADLDSDDFTVREQASKALRNLGRFIVPSLRKALEAKPGDEVQRRLTELLDAAVKAAPPPEVLRVGRGAGGAGAGGRGGGAPGAGGVAEGRADHLDARGDGRSAATPAHGESLAAQTESERRGVSPPLEPKPAG